MKRRTVLLARPGRLDQLPQPVRPIGHLLALFSRGAKVIEAMRLQADARKRED
ncbi:hypothetical protein AB0F16_27965 [Streptomyces tanashiensis]|uniref:hypothetical protein n=1 Tax=Streptomyces tanashiensis TaxID=67367 RepID=UPI0033D86277